MTNLSKANAHDGKCDEDAPDHCSLIQIFGSVPALTQILNKSISGEDKFDAKGVVLPESPSAYGGFDSQSQHSYSRALPVPRFPSEVGNGRE